MRKHCGQREPGSIRALRHSSWLLARRFAGAATVATVAVVAAVLLAPFAQASGPRTLTPEFFATPVARAELIDGTAFAANDSFSRTLLYLHLSGRFTAAHRELFSGVRPTMPQTGLSSAFEWRQLVVAVSGGEYLINPRKYVQRGVTRNGVAATETWFLENCQSDALITAIATFNERRTRYGESSVEFRRWLDAQRIVFANCSETGLSVPAPPEAGWTTLEQQDRRYQIAASHFYNLDYATAAERFAEIAADDESPWADVSRYLVGRSRVREAVTNGVNVDANLREALALFREMAADEAYLARFPSVTGLIRYIELKLDTPAFMRATARRLLESPAELDAGALEDFLLLSDNSAFDSSGDGAAKEELLRWLRLARRARDLSPVTTAGIDQQWQNTRNPAWLYLVTVQAPAGIGAARARELRDELASLAPSTPAYPDMLIAVATLLAAADDDDGARELATAGLGDGAIALAPPQRNRLEYLLANLIEDPIERLARSDFTPVAMRYDGSSFASHGGASLRQATRGGTLFPDGTIEMLNRDFTPAMLLDAAERIPFNDYLEGRLVIAAWVRALLTGDDDNAMRAAERLKSSFPGLTTDLDRFIQSDDGAFAAAFIVLNHPGFSPWIPPGIGRAEYDASGVIFPAATVALPYRSYNWWCSPGSTLPTVTEFFGPTVIAHARASPDDPRVPQALHRLVFATRYACETGPGEISRAAFGELHARYPDSEWAAKTPYWYE